MSTEKCLDRQSSTSQEINKHHESSKDIILNDEKHFILIGDTGSGKSTFLNYLFNYIHGERDIESIRKNPSLLKLALPVRNYQENVGADKNENEMNIEIESKSHTIDCKEYSLKYESFEYKIIDTPGFNSTEEYNTDEKIFEKITNACLDYDYLNGVILFINGSCPRLQVSIKKLVEHLMNFLSNEISKKIILILTNTDEASCNIGKELLYDLNKLNSDPKRFFMQNNIFKWDRLSEQPNKKNWREISNNWENSLDTIKEIFDELNKCEPVSTKYFRKVKKQTENVLTQLKTEMRNIFSLIDLLDEIEIKGIALQQANTVMLLNQKHKNEFVIEAIPIVWKEDSDPESSIDDCKKKKKTSLVKTGIDFVKSKANGGFNKIKNLAKTENDKIPLDQSKSDPLPEIAPSLENKENVSREREWQSELHILNEVSENMDKLNIDEKIKPIEFDQEESDKVHNSPIENIQDIDLSQAKETPMHIDETPVKDAFVTTSDKKVAEIIPEHLPMKKSNNKLSKPRNKPAPIKLSVKIDDNEAINQYKNAEFQENAALTSIVDLNEQIEEIKRGISSSFKSIELHIEESKSICKGFNFLQFFYPIQKEFKAKADESIYQTGLIGEYYEKFDQIIKNALKME